MFGLVLGGIGLVGAIGSKIKADINDYNVREYAKGKSPLGIYTDSYGNFRNISDHKVVTVNRENGDRVIRDSKGRFIRNVDASLRYMEAYDLWRKGVEENPDSSIIECEYIYISRGKKMPEGQVYREANDFDKAYVKRAFCCNHNCNWEDPGTVVFGGWSKYGNIRRENEILVEFYMNIKTGMMEKLTEDCERILSSNLEIGKYGFYGTLEEAEKFRKFVNEQQEKGGLEDFDYFLNNFGYDLRTIKRV